MYKVFIAIFVITLEVSYIFIWSTYMYITKYYIIFTFQVETMCHMLHVINYTIIVWFQDKQFSSVL